MTIAGTYKITKPLHNNIGKVFDAGDIGELREEDGRWFLSRITGKNGARYDPRPQFEEFIKCGTIVKIDDREVSAIKFKKKLAAKLRRERTAIQRSLTKWERATLERLLKVERHRVGPAGPMSYTGMSEAAEIAAQLCAIDDLLAKLVD